MKLSELEKLLDEEEHIRDIEAEFRIYEEMSKLQAGKQIRDYMKAHKEEMKRYGIDDVPLHYRYPNLHIIISVIGCVISIIALLLKLLI
jgi:hypothetical protein